MTEPRPIALVAMGGHAFMQKGESGTIEEHETNAARICEALLLLIDRGYNLVVTHGNGPQVGNLLLQQESCRKVPQLPLEILVAQTQGQIGYMIESTLDAQLMAWYSGVAEKRHLAQITRNVGAADPNTMHTYQCLVRSGRDPMIDRRRST